MVSSEANGVLEELGSKMLAAVAGVDVELKEVGEMGLFGEVFGRKLKMGEEVVLVKDAVDAKDGGLGGRGDKVGEICWQKTLFVLEGRDEGVGIGLPAFEAELAVLTGIGRSEEADHGEIISRFLVWVRVTNPVRVVRRVFSWR